MCSAPMDEEGDVTTLARRWSQGDEASLARLIELIYPRLRRLASRHLALGRGDPTIDTTALVHEAYLRLAGEEGSIWPSRAHFFAFCSKVMRRVLIDHARRLKAEKRGGAWARIPLSDDVAAVESQVADLLQVDEILGLLAERNERMARVVECRFYGGLSIEETAEALGTSPRTVVREWTRARSYILQALDPAGASPGPDES